MVYIHIVGWCTVHTTSNCHPHLHFLFCRLNNKANDLAGLSKRLYDRYLFSYPLQNRSQNNVVCLQSCLSWAAILLYLHYVSFNTQNYQYLSITRIHKRRLAKVLGVWCTNNIEVCAVKRIHMRGTFQETSQRHLAVINHKGTVSCCQKQRPFRKRTKYIEQQKETISYIVYCIKSDGNRRKRNLVARYSGIFIAPNYVMQVRERLDLDREFMHCNSLLRKSLFYSLDSLRYSRHTISKTHIHLRVWVRVFLLV